MAYHIKFKDKTSMKWFRSAEFPDSETMMSHYWGKIRAVASDVEFHAPGGMSKPEGPEQSPEKVKEETTMAKSIVEHIVAGDAVALQESFDTIIAERVELAIDELRPEVYASMFGADKIAESDKDTRFRRRAKIEADKKAKAKKSADEVSKTNEEVEPVKEAAYTPTDADNEREWKGTGTTKAAAEKNTAKKPEPKKPGLAGPSAAKPVFGKRK